MEYLIHHVKFEIWPALCKFPILFSDFWMLDVGCTSKFLPIQKEIEN